MTYGHEQRIHGVSSVPEKQVPVQPAGPHIMTDRCFSAHRMVGVSPHWRPAIITDAGLVES